MRDVGMPKTRGDVGLGEMSTAGNDHDSTVVSPAWSGRSLGRSRRQALSLTFPATVKQHRRHIRKQLRLSISNPVQGVGRGRCSVRNRADSLWNASIRLCNLSMNLFRFHCWVTPTPDPKRFVGIPDQRPHRQLPASLVDSGAITGPIRLVTEDLEFVDSRIGTEPVRSDELRGI